MFVSSTFKLFPYYYYSLLSIIITIILISIASNNHVYSQQIVGTLKAEFTYTLDEGYPIGSKLFGNIAGVDIDKDNNVIIFHRGSHIWNENTFDINDVYQLSKQSPIPEETVVTIDPKEKKIVRAWGRNTFYLPHGLSLDLEAKNVWLTDVAMHQVFKYPIDGSKELIVLGTAFVPGNDESHFCKPTSVADTGEFIFVADGYCNSRIVMFSADGRYLGEFGQSSDAAYLSSQTNGQPTFNIPHKITYAKEANMLCIADRENGRIQCFTFEPKQKASLASDSASSSSSDKGLILSGAIRPKFTIADPQFSGRLFSIDYCPIKGGIIVAVSGKSLYSNNKPALGFVYNVTTGQLISRFSPASGKTFGMAHDLAVTSDDAESIYVVDIAPVNLWRFSRPIEKHKNSRAAEITKMAGDGINKAISLIREKDHSFGFLWYVFMISILAMILFAANKTRRLTRNTTTNSFASLYSNTYPASINSLFGNSGRQTYARRANGIRNSVFSTMFSRRAFFNLFDRAPQQQNDFSRIPLEDSDNSDNDKSDSDVEEFNINQANTSIKINV